MVQYAVLMADVKNSRSYRSVARDNLQILLSESISYLNEIFSESLIKKVMFSAGDEVQGLFHDAVSACLYYRMLYLLMGPDVLRGGIGLGGWSVFLEEEGSTGQDGEAYHRARAAIDRAKTNKHFDLVFRSGGAYDDALTILLDHSLGICKMRTAAQNETALVVELMRPIVLGSGDFRFLEKGASTKELFIRGLDVLYRKSLCSQRQASKLIEGVLRAGEGGMAFLWRPVGLREFVCDSEWPILSGKDLTGISYDLANVAGVSRQGLDRKISQGRIFQERSAIVAFACIARRFL